jgi:hypothetical protein
MHLLAQLGLAIRVQNDAFGIFLRPDDKDELICILGITFGERLSRLCACARLCRLHQPALKEPQRIVHRCGA